MVFSAILSTAGCCQIDQRVLAVEPTQYAQINKCWMIDKSFTAFVIVHLYKGNYYPYFISVKCYTKSEWFDRNKAFFDDMDRLKVCEDNGSLRNNGLFPHDLKESASLHTPAPSNSDRVYLYVGGYELNNTVFGQRLTIREPKKFLDIKIDLRQFTQMSPEVRLLTALEAY